MAKDAKGPELHNRVDALTNKIDRLTNTVEQLISERRPEKEESKYKSWTTNLSILIGLIAGVVAVVYQLGQTDNTTATTEKTMAETEQIKLTTLKQKSDLLLDSLINQKTKSLADYNEVITRDLPRLQGLIQEMNDVRVRSNSEMVLPKYIAIWALIWSVGLFFRIFGTIWNSLIGVTLSRIMRWANKDYNSRSRQRVRNISEVAVYFISPLGQLFDIILCLGIFATLVVPMFNETAILLGSDLRFSDVMGSLKGLRFTEALEKTRGMLFP